MRSRAIYGNHILLSRSCCQTNTKENRSWKNKSSTGVDRSSCTNNITHEHTSQCNSTNTHHHPPIQHSTHTHTHTHTHQYKRIVCFALFLKLGDTVCNTVWNLYISMLPIYIYLYKSHIYTYDLTTAGSDCFVSWHEKDGITVTDHDVHEISVTL